MVVDFAAKHEISFAYTSFKWANLASHNAGVSVIVVGISNHVKGPRKIFSTTEDLGTIIKEVDNINAYLVAGKSTIVAQRSFPLSEVSVMDFGSMANDDGGLLFDRSESSRAVNDYGADICYFRKAWGAKEFISGTPRACLWLNKDSAKKQF